MTIPSVVATTNTVVPGDVSTSVSKPTGTLSGHGLLMVVCADGLAVATSTGWTEVQSSAGYTVLGKVAGASEPSSYTVSMSAECDGTVLVMAFSGVSGTFPHVSAKATSTTNAPSVTTTLPDCLLVLLGLHQASATTVPSGSTSIASVSYAGAKSIVAARKDQTAAGASGTNAFGASRDWVATVAIAGITASAAPAIGSTASQQRRRGYPRRAPQNASRPFIVVDNPPGQQQQGRTSQGQGMFRKTPINCHCVGADDGGIDQAMKLARLVDQSLSPQDGVTGTMTWNGLSVDHCTTRDLYDGSTDPQEDDEVGYPIAVVSVDVFHLACNS